MYLISTSLNYFLRVETFLFNINATSNITFSAVDYCSLVLHICYHMNIICLCILTLKHNGHVYTQSVLSSIKSIQRAPIFYFSLSLSLSLSIYIYIYIYICIIKENTWNACECISNVECKVRNSRHKRHQNNCYNE